VYVRYLFILSAFKLIHVQAYRGYRGKAVLYSCLSPEATNIGPETVQLMQTGAYSTLYVR
jgi:hypothetical protein